MRINTQCVNPLTTNDECTHHTTLVARHQLAESVLKICFALAKKDGTVGIVMITCCAHDSCLAVEKTWSALAKLYTCISLMETAPLPL